MAQRDLRARRTMHALHTALLELIENHSFEQLTVDDIVERASVGRSTFYRHYGTKEDLMNEIARTEIDSLFAIALPPIVESDTYASSLRLVTYVDSRRKLWAALLTGGAAALMKQRFIELAKTVGAKAMGVREPGMPMEMAAAVGVAASVEILAWWLAQDDPFSIEKVARLHDRLAVRPLYVIPEDEADQRNP